MGKLDLLQSRLYSRAIRKNLASGRTGSQILDHSLPFAPPRGGAIFRKVGTLTKLQSQQGEGGFLSFLWDKGSQLVGWVASAAWNFLSFSATTIWSWVVNGINALKAFNWNATDKELQAMVGDQNLLLAQIWGGVVGQGLGWLAGIGVGYGVSFLCPVIGGAALARTIAAKTATEMTEELIPAIGFALRATAGAFVKAGLINGYINYRRFLKAAPRPLLEAIYGADGADFIQKTWGAQGGPNMSFNTVMDEAIERIPNQYVKAFIEEMLEESWDSFTEAGFIVAQGIDEAYAQAKQASQTALGTARSVEVILDSKADEKEKIHFTNTPQRLLMPAIQQHINHYRMIHNRDVGMMFGLPLDEYVRARAQTLTIVIDMFSRKEPPFYRGAQKDIKAVTLTIPNVKRSKLDWATIKRCVGGVNGYLWGRFRANVTLSGGRTLRVYGGTEREAEERAKALLELTEDELLSLSITEEKKEGERQKRPKLFKETVRVYPGYFTVINRQELLDPNRGRASLTQNYRDAKVRIPLWLDKEPANVERLISNLLRRGF